MCTGVLAKLGDHAPHRATVLAVPFAYFPISCHFISEHNANEILIDFCMTKLLSPWQLQNEARGSYLLDKRNFEKILKLEFNMHMHK